MKKTKTAILFMVVMLTFNGNAHSLFWLELEGLLYFNSYGKNVQISINEELSCNILPFFNVGLGLYHQYRNYSMISSVFGEGEYRLLFKRFSIPLGVFGGWKTIHIGAYVNRIPFMGPTIGFNWEHSPFFSIRTKFRYSLYFEEKKYIHGTTVLLGFCFALWNKE